MNIKRFMMGTKWLPQYNSRAKERGLSRETLGTNVFQEK